jgi:microcystin-dependent protein
MLSVSQYAALYSLLGTTFGGTNNQNFAIPNLQGRTLIGQGSVGSTLYQAAHTGGAAAVTLTPSQVPLASHTHPLSGAPTGTVSFPASAGPATDSSPTPGSMVASAFDAIEGTPVNIYGPASSPSIPLAAGTVSLTGLTVGSNAPTTPTAQVPTMPPYLAVYYLIAINGLYPTRP